MVVRLFLYNNSCLPVLTPSAKVRYRSHEVTRLDDVTTLARVPSQPSQRRQRLTPVIMIVTQITLNQS